MDEMLNDPQATNEMFIDIKNRLEEDITVLQEYENQTGIVTGALEPLMSALENIKLMVQDLGTVSQEVQPVSEQM